VQIIGAVAFWVKVAGLVYIAFCSIAFMVLAVVQHTIAPKMPAWIAVGDFIGFCFMWFWIIKALIQDLRN